MAIEIADLSMKNRVILHSELLVSQRVFDLEKPAHFIYDLVIMILF